MRRQELVRYRDALAARLAALERGDAGPTQDLAAGAEELPDPADRATRETDLDGALRLRDRDRHHAARIALALQRIDEGTFGHCSRCGEPIPPERLEARPETDLCIDCMREVEVGARRA